jgi:hypothetical protein
MNECRIVEDLIPLYAESLTNEEASEFVKNHVANCDRCRKLLERCQITVPVPEKDVKAYKKALQKNTINMTCRIVVVALVLLIVFYIGCTKLGEYMLWKDGRAPVEQVVKAPVGNGEVTLVDWEASGYSIGGTENTGTLIWFEMKDARENEYGTSYSWNEGGYSQAWENVQIYWAPNGKPFLVTADLPEGGEGIFVHHYKSWYDEKGKHFSESRFLPNTRGNGLVDVLTALCKEIEAFPTGWETVDFTFHQWQDDSETITFVYETDNGIRGLIDYHYPTEAITKVN